MKNLESGFILLLLLLVSNVSAEILPSGKANGIQYSGSNSIFRTDFILDDVVVSNPEDNLFDPEFDKENLRMAWQEPFSGNLWISDIDPVNGTWKPLDGRQTLIDTDLAVISATRQGPEWAYDNEGNRLVYTRIVDQKQPHLYQARYTSIDNILVVTPLENGENRAVAQASRDPGDLYPRIIYNYIDQATHQTVLGWREIDNPETDTLLPKNFRNAKWVAGQRAIISTNLINGVRQVVHYMIDSGLTTQLTFDSTNKRFPLMWWDSTLQDYILAAIIDNTAIGIWHKNDQNQWVLINNLRPPTKTSYIFKPDWFTWNNASYLAYLMHTEKSGKQQKYRGKGEVWVTRVMGDGPFLHRQVNNPATTRIKDVENLIVTSKVYIYYTEILPDEQRRLIHKADTGL